MQKIIKNIYLLIIPLIIVFTYWDLPKTFYQQDEWQALGHILTQGIGNIVHYTTPEQLLLGGGRPLSRGLNLILLGYFKFDILPASIFAVLIHSINSLLVFYLAKRLFNKIWISFFASLFFALNSISSQSITWVAAVGGLPATTFLIISLIFYVRFLGENKRKYVYLSYLFGLISLLFKESALFLFILYPVSYFLFKEKIRIREFLIVHAPLIFYGGLIAVFRYLGLFFRNDNAVGFVGVSDNPIRSALVHIVLYPLTSLFQIFVPPTDLYNLTPLIIKTQYKFLIDSPARDLVAQSIVADMVSSIGAFLILGVTLFIAFRANDRFTKKGIIFMILFFFLSLLPYIVVHRDSSYLSSRYFYVSAISAGIIFGLFMNYIIKLNKLLIFIVVPLVFVYMNHNIGIIKKEITFQSEIAAQRKAVLNGISEIYPKLENNSIYYVISDRNYYGNITNPFQNGLGYVLEVWNYDSGKIPSSFLTENFLWDLGAEGYDSKGNLGFGYFQDMDKMVGVINSEKLSPEVIHGFFIDSANNKVIDITRETRERVATVSSSLND